MGDHMSRLVPVGRQLFQELTKRTNGELDWMRDRNNMRAGNRIDERVFHFGEIRRPVSPARLKAVGV